MTIKRKQKSAAKRVQTQHNHHSLQFQRDNIVCRFLCARLYTWPRTRLRRHDTMSTSRSSYTPSIHLLNPRVSVFSSLKIIFTSKKIHIFAKKKQRDIVLCPFPARAYSLCRHERCCHGQNKCRYPLPYAVFHRHCVLNPSPSHRLSYHACDVVAVMSCP